MNDLKPCPCPFCGKTSGLTVDNLVGDDWYVECSFCRVQQQAIYQTDARAIAAWNRRAPASDATPTPTPTPVVSSGTLEANAPSAASEDAPSIVIGAATTEQEPPYSLYEIDECMYVAALTEADAVAYVKDECGEDCASQVHEIGLDIDVETADVDEGEERTATSRRTARVLVDEYMAAGGMLPWTVAYSGDM